MAAAGQQPYPRPDWVRPDSDWKSLNGPWNFHFDDHDIGLAQGWHRTGLPDTQQVITVPFAFQTPASGIKDRGAHEVIWYSRQLPEATSSATATSDKRCMLRFGAVDYEAQVWLAGHFVGRHRGGHVPFELDLTDALLAAKDAEALLVVRVRDSPHDLTQPRGKQYWAPKPESIWYTPTSGIWQNVWLEWAPRTRIGDSSAGTIIRSNDVANAVLHAKFTIVDARPGAKLRVRLVARREGKNVAEQEQDVGTNGYVYVDLKLSTIDPGTEAASPHQGLVLWSPQSPNLYDLTIQLRDENGTVLDTVETYFGMRSLEWTTGDSSFRLNGQRYFQALVLDQGYWPDTGLTPPSEAALRTDIEISKAMGFNGCRKHQKAEDPLFLHWANKLGYIVWGEMANAYEFDDVYVDRFDQEWIEAVRRDINHPCVVTWTPGNESWGYKNLQTSVQERNHLRSLYYRTKTLDPTRPINENCGWEHVVTDLVTFHDYTAAEELAKTCSTMEGVLDKKSGRYVFTQAIEDSTIADPACQARSDAPVICTEFGGINIAPKSKDDSKEGDWGYTTATDSDDLLQRIEGMMLGIVKGNICCGFVYTQLTDIEQEVNGLYTFDRKPKLDPVKMSAIVEKAKFEYYKRFVTAD